MAMRIKTAAQRTKGICVSFKHIMTDARKIRRTRRWREVSEMMRRSYPLCMSRKHCRLPILSSEVHHIVSIEANKDLAFTEENLVPLCSTCHAEVTELEKLGRPTQHLFKNWQHRRD